MLPLSQPTAFIPSSFTPPLRSATNTRTKSPKRTSPQMVAPKHVRRAEEIKRLTKQLEELRAAKARGARSAPKQTAPSASKSPSPSSPPSPPPATSSPPPPPTLPLGKHGAGSRFLSLSQVEDAEYFPRILTVAGRVPGLTVEQLLGTPPVLQNGAPEAGSMFLTMLPEGYQGQIIALPGMELISTCNDPVVIMIDPAELSETQLPVEEGDDVVLVLERNVEGLEFDKTKFYAWDDGGRVRVGWLKEMPEGGKCLGQILFGMLEVKKELRKKKSCWEEENETYTA